MDEDRSRDTGFSTDGLDREYAQGAAAARLHLQRQLDDERYAQWVETMQASHHNAHPTTNDELSWTPLSKSIAQARIALLTSTGVHLDDQEPFDILDPDGDWSYRLIPGDTDTRRLTATHGHIDTARANRDINCVFPLDRLRELRDEGLVGEVSPVHIGLMGFCPDGRRMRDETGPAVAELLREAGVDAVVMTPG